MSFGGQRVSAFPTLLDTRCELMLSAVLQAQMQAQCATEDNLRLHARTELRCLPSALAQPRRLIVSPARCPHVDVGGAEPLLLLGRPGQQIQERQKGAVECGPGTERGPLFAPHEVERNDWLAGVDPLHASICLTRCLQR